MPSHRVTSIELKKRSKATGHDAIIAVETAEAHGPQRWTTKQVVTAMDRAERFFTQASNGRQARVERYACPSCGAEHIRTHISDMAIHDMRALEGSASHLQDDSVRRPSRRQ